VVAGAQAALHHPGALCQQQATLAVGRGVAHPALAAAQAREHLAEGCLVHAPHHM